MHDPLHVDGLSGATITSNGVSRLTQFWMSDNGYGKFLKRFPWARHEDSAKESNTVGPDRRDPVRPRRSARRCSPRIIANNPIGVQVLGICSALAVTTRMDKALVMGIGVTIVTACANLAVSTVRN